VGQKRILIVSQYSLFDQGIGSALRQQADVEVIGVCHDLEEAYGQAQALHPDVLLIISRPEIVRDNAFRLLEEVSPSIIRISPTEGTMQVYHREQVDQASLDDLMTAIQATAIQFDTEGREDFEPQPVESKTDDHQTRPRRESMKHFIIVAVLVAIVTLLVIFGLNRIQLLPMLASEEGIPIDNLFGLHIIVIAFLFALIVVFMLYSIVAFRRKPGEEGDGAHLLGNTRLEIVWTIAPLATVLFFSFLGARALGIVTAAEPNELAVDVTAAQFSWRFDYPDYGITSADLNLPLGRQAVFNITSEDVIHDFWVVEFRVKQDAVPGQVHSLRVTPTHVGQYKIRCAELCGTGHAYMLADVNVMEPADFEAWVAEQLAPSELSGVELGVEIAQLQGCIGCHSTDGSQLVGPTWLGLYGSEEALEDGTNVTVDDAYITKSILDPAIQITEGFPNVMPATYQDTLSEEDIDALIEYIKSLGE
jgi:cytochrome c oxidase subunit 2